jgi:hypothetical protein
MRNTVGNVHLFLGVTQRFADLRWAGFSAQMFLRRTALSATTKLSAENETPPIANVLLAAVIHFLLSIMALTLAS